MSEWSESKLPAMEDEDLSALVDGELSASAVDRACARWRDDHGTRASWHAYQLIGDVLRSEELATVPQRDNAFLSALQQRLAQEPVVLAPAALVVAEKRSSVRAWRTSAAVAAGFVVVAGAMVATQMSGVKSVQVESQVAQSASAPEGFVQVRDQEALAAPMPAVDMNADPQAVILNGQLIRDVRLDEYLAAHKRFGGSSAPGVPSGFLRNAAVDGTAR